MSNRNKSVAPYQGGGGGGLVPRGHFKSAFDEFDSMADRMMANFGMPKMDLSIINNWVNKPYSDALRWPRPLQR